MLRRYVEAGTSRNTFQGYMGGKKELPIGIHKPLSICLPLFIGLAHLLLIPFE